MLLCLAFASVTRRYVYCGASDFYGRCFRFILARCEWLQVWPLSLDTVPIDRSGTLTSPRCIVVWWWLLLVADVRLRHMPLRESVASTLTFLSCSGSYHPCVCRRLLSAVSSSLAAGRLRQICRTTPEPTCLHPVQFCFLLNWHRHEAPDFVRDSLESIPQPTVPSRFSRK